LTLISTTLTNNLSFIKQGIEQEHVIVHQFHLPFFQRVWQFARQY